MIPMSDEHTTGVSAWELMEFIGHLNRVLALGSAVTDEERLALLGRKENILRRMGPDEGLPGARKTITQAWAAVGSESPSSRTEGGEW